MVADSSQDHDATLLVYFENEAGVVDDLDPKQPVHCPEIVAVLGSRATRMTPCLWAKSNVQYLLFFLSGAG